MGNAVNNAGVFLIYVVFQLYLFILMARLLLQVFRASYFNPVIQFITKATDPLVLPLRKIIPRVRFVDIPILIIMLLLEFIKYSLIVWLSISAWPSVAPVLLSSIGDLLRMAINIFFYSILIMVVISWINPGLQSPLTEILYSLTEPLMRPVRRVIPPIGGFDISALPVMIGLQLLIILLVNPLIMIRI